MTPAEIDAAERYWAARLDTALTKAVEGYRRDMISPGRPADEVEAEVAAYAPRLDEYRAARCKEILGLIVSARYGTLAQALQHGGLANDR